MAGIQFSSEMNEFSEVAKTAGFHLDFQSTGSADWTRCFMTLQGISVARVSFHEGYLYNIKWYGSSFDPAEFVLYARMSLSYTQITGECMSDEFWKQVQETAAMIYRNDLRHKQEWRDKNPKFDARGCKVNRKPLAGRSAYSTTVEAMKSLLNVKLLKEAQS